MHKTLLTIFFLLLRIYAFPQHPLYYQFTEKDGLPDYIFYDMRVDEKGYLWLAAESGLYRYDGNEFKFYTHPDKKGFSVFGLLEDREGNMWFNNLSGQICYVQKDTVITFTDVHKYTKGRFISQFTKYKDKLYSTGSEGLVEIDLLTKEKRLFENNEAENYSCGDLILYNNEVWAIERKDYKIYNLLKINSKGDYYRDFRFPKLQKLFPAKNHLFASYRKSNGKTDLYYWQENENTFIPFKIPDFLEKALIVHVYEDIEGYLWFSTDVGAIRFRVEDQQMKEVSHYFKETFVSRVVQDTRGTYWFSAVKGGIKAISNLNITSYKNLNNINQVTEINALATDNVAQVFFDIGRQGVGVFNKQTQKFSWYDQKNRDSDIIKMKFDTKRKRLIGVGNHTFFFKDSLGEYFDDEGQKDFAVTSDTTLLLSSVKGSQVINNITGVTKENHKEKYSDIVKIKHVKKLRSKRALANYHSKKNQRIYIGYIDGLYVYDTSFNESLITHHNKTLVVSAFVETEDGLVWAASVEYGLVVIKDQKITETIGTESFGDSRRITTLEVQGNNVWVGTNKGVYKIVREKSKVQEIISLDNNDGLDFYDIHDMEILGNDLYVATQKGLLKLDMCKPYTNKNKPNILIEEIEINENKVALENYYKLPYDSNVTIRFNSTSFLHPDIDKTYKYRLKGVDKDWVVKKDEEVRYASFPYGEYRFEVKAVNEDGLESEMAAHIDFEITPPFWFRWWFYVLIGFLFTGVTALIFRTRIQRLKEKEAIEVELVNSKLIALRAQMNPHFLFNALNSIQKYILTNQKDIASDYLGQFADLMRIYLDHSKRNVITLKEEMDALDLYLQLEKVRFKEELKYQIKIKNQELLSDFIKIPSLLIQPYVENAIKHGLLHKKENKFLKIKFKKCKHEENVIICEIKDNGIGRARSAEINQYRINHTSHASEAGKTRLELLNYDKQKQIGIEIIDLEENDKPTGTKVILRIPYT